MAEIEQRHWDRASELITSEELFGEGNRPDALIAQALADAEEAGRTAQAEDPQPSTGIRVLRILEYVYPDAQTMELDMANWAAPRTMRGPKGTWMRSTVLPLEVLGG